MKKFSLIIIFVIIVALAGFFCFGSGQKQMEKDEVQITTDINKNMEIYKNTSNAMLIDVRTKDEYADEGYIEDSINIPLDEINDINVDKDTILFVYCRSGKRAQSAVDILTEKGYKAYNIGGIMDYKGITVR